MIYITYFITTGEFGCGKMNKETRSNKQRSNFKY